MILAAGKGERFGGCKAAALINGASALEHCALAFLCVEKIIVVTGAWRDEIPHIEKCRYVHNEFYERGMFSSIITGINSVKKKYSGIFITPVDIPLFSAQTVQKMMDVFMSHGGKKWCVPTFEGKSGHPVLIPATYIEELKNWHSDGGLDIFLEEKIDDCIKIAVSEKNILMDFDTLDDIAELEEYFQQNKKATT